MPHDDAWRRRLAEERYGDSLTPGFARGGSAGMALPAVGRAEPPPAAEFVRPAPTASRRGTRQWIGWAAAAAVAMVVAAALGWFAHGERPSRIVYLPLAAPPMPVPAAAPTPRAAGPVDAVAAPPAATAAPPDEVASVTAAPSPMPRPASSRPPAARVKAAVRPSAAPRHRRPSAATPAAPAAVTGPAPAFPCVPGAGPASRSLCDDPALRRFDEQMQEAAAAVVAHRDGQLIALADRGRAGFLRRRDRCPDAACLTRVYAARIVALVRLLPAGAATPPICQPEQYTRTPLMDCWPWRLRDTRKPFYSK